MLWTNININKPRARLGIGRVRSRAVCWLLKQARAAVDENEEAASSNRSRYAARHMPSAAMASRAARAGRRQPNSSNAAHKRSCAIRLAVRLIRESAPKGARMFTSNDVTSKCEAQSSQASSRHRSWTGISSGPLAVRRSRERAPTPSTVARSSKHGELHVAFRSDVACVEQRNAGAQTVEKPHPSARKRHGGSKFRLGGSMGRVHVVKAN